MTAGSPATAHLFIVNPFSGKGLVRLFRTHPSTEERIARLQALLVRVSRGHAKRIRERP